MKIRVSELRALISETVIDARDKFKKRKADVFLDKLQRLASDIPDVFQRQKELERLFNERMNNIAHVIDDYVSQKRMKIAAPIAFSDDEGWGANGTVFDVIAHAYRGSPGYTEVARFVKANAESFNRSAAALAKELNSIEDDADSYDWPAPWKRYTQWASIKSAVQRFVDNLYKMLR